MNSTPDDPDDGISRRAMLAAGAAGLSIGSSGCIERVQSVVDPDRTERLSLSIVTVPAADGDRESAEIARHLESNLEKVGIEATINTRSQSELLQSVLIDHDFDLYVGRHPADFDPDFLYEALHSTYANESGWQNPFGFTNMAFDTLLERQREEDGDDRVRSLRAVLEGIAQEKPFEPICIPEEHRLVRTDRFDEWDEDHLATRLGYLGLEPDAGVDQLHALLTDQRPTQSLNPLSATARERGVVVDLLYDSLAVPTWTVPDDEETDGNGGDEDVTDAADVELEPWLATDWEWRDDGTRTMTVDIREDCTFHDGTDLTAEDVAFTYRFLSDTTYGRAETPSPAPRYRGQAAAVDSVTVEDDYRLTMTFSTGEAVAERALTVPILPSGPESPWIEHLENRVDDADDFSPSQGDWSIVTTSHVPPTGSGPYQFADRTEGESLTLARFDDHFTLRDDVDLPEPSVDELYFEVDPGTASSVERVINGSADITTSRLETHALEEDPDDPAVETIGSPSWTFYHVGFNTRRAPFSNSHFRRAVARLIDKEWVVDEIFAVDDSARPVATPVAEEWTPDSLVWDDGELVTSFVGSGGELDVEAARSLFSSHFQYDDEGKLLR